MAASRKVENGDFGSTHRFLSSSIIKNNNNNNNNNNKKKSSTGAMIDLLLSSNEFPAVRAVMGVTGGGSNAISSLLSTPGASSLLLEATVPYDRLAFASFVSSHPPLLPPPPQQLTTPDTPKNSDQFRFASSTAAATLSNASLHRAMQLTPTLQQMKHCMGLGASSALISEFSRPTFCPRVHVSIHMATGYTYSYQLTLDNNNNNNNNHHPRRTRMEEEEIATNLILSAMAHAQSGHQHQNNNSDIVHSTMTPILNRPADSLTSSHYHSFLSDIPSQSSQTHDHLIEIATQRIISGQTDAVLLLPHIQHQKHQLSVDMLPLTNVVLPSDPIIIPGSFNPPHMGHIGLAMAAAKIISQKRRQEQDSAATATTTTAATTNDAIWNATTKPASTNPSILFEISVTNPDKPSLSKEEASKRVSYFGQLFRNYLLHHNGHGDTDLLEKVPNEMPEDWGVLLTGAPLFAQKVPILSQCLAPSISSPNNYARHHCENQTPHRRMTFVIGTDTMVRIINPKYYNNDMEAMLTALREMNYKYAVHFVVGGRLEQNTVDASPKFVSGEEELLSLPEDVRDMFSLLNEDDFRIDISSTAIRESMAASKQ